MPSITWYGDYGTTGAGSGGKITSLTSYSGSLPSGATITSVTYSLDMSAQWSSTSLYWKIFWLHAVNANSSTATTGAGIGTIGSSTEVVSEQASNQQSGGATHTFTGSLTLYNSSVFQNTTIYCNTKANISGSPSSYMKTISITVNYSVKPSTPTLSAYPNPVLTNESLDLSWTTSTSATSYQVSYGPNGTENTQTVTTTYWNNATKPSAGVTWKYKVRGVGTEYGDWSNVVSVTAVTKIKHPTSVTLSSTSVTTGASVTLSWSGASDCNGMRINRFYIYRSSNINEVGDTIESKTVSDGTTSGSTTITAPSSPGTYYYRVQAERYGWENYSEDFTKDTSYAALTVIGNGVTTPTAVRINGAAADPSTTVQASTFNLSWIASVPTGSVSGTITYHIMVGVSASGQAFTEVGTTTSTSFNVPNPSQYTSLVEYYIYATCSGYTSGNTPYYSYKYGALSPPTNIRLGGSTISIESTNPTITSSGNLSWGRATLTGQTGTIRYHVTINNREIGYVDKSSTDTADITYTISNITSYTSTTRVDVYATYSSLTSSSIGGYFKYSPITVTPPGKPTVSQNNDNTLSISWSPSTGSGGSGAITYSILVYNSSTLIAQINNQTSTARVNISSNSIPYATNLTCVIRASYSGVTADSDGTAFTANKPTITMGNVSSSFSDGKITVSWQNATQSYSSGTIIYHMKIGSGSEFTVTGNSYEVPNPSQYTTDTTVAMYASDSYATSSTKTTTIKFTATIKYYNGTAWVDCVVSYYDGTKWVSCIVKVYNGTSWV